ncbi:hypothetical protein MLD38_006310 [Melastoma candidum]|uniref:Uncharacterized protein n=1 Tax=Melastoma candidum TaxID=119954 RepID=A0ACB9RM41_9MYRT|nr:hypothetical protein MLD38_006310 [Melastoma candidum]
MFRIYGQDPLVDEKTPKVLFSTPKSEVIRSYKQADCELVKIDINCHLQGDVVLECIHVSEDLEREQMIFRTLFNSAFIRLNILMLNRDEIDTFWERRDLFAKDFRTEILFSEMDAITPIAAVDLLCFEEKEGLPIEAFAKAQEFFSHVDWLAPKMDTALDVIQQANFANAVLDKASTDFQLRMETWSPVKEKMVYCKMR